MTEEIKKEVLSPENWTDGELETKPVNKRLGECDEMTIMKTEVIEERYDFETRWDEFVLFPGDESTVKYKEDFIVEDPLEIKYFPIDGEGFPLMEDSTEKKRHICTFCKYSTDLKRDLLQHSCTHTKEKPFKCSICEFATAYKHSLKTHVLLKHSDKDKKLKCGQCEYSTYRKTVLKKHAQRHVVEKTFECNACNFTTGRKIYLQIHQLLKHTERVKRYKCETCEYATTSEYLLKNHLRIHSINELYKCTYKACGCRKRGDGKKLCECVPCNFVAVDKISLEKHMLVKHCDKKKKYSCECCDYSPYTKKSLATHVYQHDDCKPFGYDVCDYTTVFKAKLKNHVLLRHSDEKRVDLWIRKF